MMFVIGIDVSKHKLHCALLVNAEPLKLKTKALSNSAAGFATLLTWAQRHSGGELDQLHFILEATGVYHEACALALYQAGAKVSVVNPAQLRDFAKGLAVKTKTDAADRVVLARYGHLVQPPAWQPPPPEVMALRALLARLEAVEADIRREHNRLEKAQFTATPKAVRASLHESLAFLQQQKAELEKKINDHIDRHPHLKRDHALLTSIPAVGPKTAWRMIVVLRGRSFSKATQAAAYLGLVPVEHESGTSVYKRPRLSKAGNARLRAALYMAAIVATRYNPDIRAHYQRLLDNGKSKMAALGAAMRKLVHICYGVLKHQTPYQPQNAN